MGYYVSKEKSRRGWYVEFEGQGLRKRVNKKDWPSGLTENLSVEQARQAARHINEVDKVQKREKARLYIRERLEKVALATTASLPPNVVKEFEVRLRDLKIRVEHWATATKAIAEMSAKIPPESWGKQPTVLYDWCVKNAYSIDYVNTLRRVVNLWGDTLTESKGTRFKDIPAPRGAHRNRIQRAYESHPGGRSRPSGRLSFKHLWAERARFADAEYNWLFVSIAFGLRPEEMERAITTAAGDKWAVTKRGLHVYQFKQERLGVPKRERWKLIEILLPEQKTALELIKAGGLSRPPEKTLEGLVDQHGTPITHYGGRKEFFPMMRLKGYDEAKVSRWMGHKTVDTARRHYDDPSDAVPWEDDEEAA